MFGSILPFADELKVREYRRYRAYYCGLCAELKKTYHASALLQYDSVFFYLLSDAFYESCEQPHQCLLHPSKGREAVITPRAQAAAALNIVMGWHKLRDDIADSRRKPYIRYAMHKRKYALAKERFPYIANAAEECARQLAQIESEQCDNTDRAAHPYAYALGNIFSEANLLYSHILYDLGYALGRWVYLSDALFDWERDEKHGNYNVYALRFGKKDESAKARIERELYFTLGECASQLDRLPLAQNEGILRNILYPGLRMRTHLALQGQQAYKKEKDGSL